MQSGEDEKSAFVVGGDALGFAHIVKCNFSAGKVSWDDLLQYGEGAMLAASQSTYDESNGQLWLQTVFDVSVTGGKPKYAAYLKQYDVATASLLNLPMDVTNAAVLVANGGVVWSVGGCNQTELDRYLASLSLVVGWKRMNRRSLWHEIWQRRCNARRTGAFDGVLICITEAEECTVWPPPLIFRLTVAQGVCAIVSATARRSKRTVGMS